MRFLLHLRQLPRMNRLPHSQIHNNKNNININFNYEKGPLRLILE
jgi:hypothetical protein